MTLGDYIKKYRQIHNLSMDDFAKMTGLSKAYVSILERNINPSTGKAAVPSLETIKRVAAATSIDFNDLIAMLDNDQEVFVGHTREKPQEQDEKAYSVAEDIKTHPLVVTGYAGSGKSNMLKKVFDEATRTQITQVSAPVSRQTGTKVIQRTTGHGSDKHIFLSYMSQSREVADDIMQYLQQKLVEQEDKSHNLICTISHDGSFRTRWLTDMQLSALNAILDQMPDATGDSKEDE